MVQKEQETVLLHTTVAMNDNQAFEQQQQLQRFAKTKQTAGCNGYAKVSRLFFNHDKARSLHH